MAWLKRRQPSDRFFGNGGNIFQIMCKAIIMNWLSSKESKTGLSQSIENAIGIKISRKKEDHWIGDCHFQLPVLTSSWRFATLDSMLAIHHFELVTRHYLVVAEASKRAMVAIKLTICHFKLAITRSSSKILRHASYFQLSFRCLEMWSSTVFRVWYVTWLRPYASHGRNMMMMILLDYYDNFVKMLVKIPNYLTHRHC